MEAAEAVILLKHPTGLQNGQAVIYTGPTKPLGITPTTGQRLLVRSIKRGGRDTLDCHHRSQSGREFVWVVAGLTEYLVLRTEIEPAP